MTITGLPIFLEELFFSVLLTFLISIFYRFLINQNELKELKARMKEKQEKAKELIKTNPQEANRITGETLALTNKQFRMTMKPMLLTLIVVGLILPVMADMYGDKISSIENNMGNITLDGKNYTLQLTAGKLSLDNIECNIPCNGQTIGGYNWNIILEDGKVKFSRVVVLLPFSLPYFQNDFGWLMWYIILSIPLGQLFRKLMGAEI